MKAVIVQWLALACSTLPGAEPIAPVSGGRGLPGYQDGIGGSARFDDPKGLARDAQGNLYLCDARNHVIRKIGPNGNVTTVAGLPGEPGALNGTGTAARFNFPADIAPGPDGTLYVADSGNHCIRVISAGGVVTTLAGDPGNADDVSQNYGASYTSVSFKLDGKGAAARFNYPGGIARAANGLLYVSDTGNHLIRSVKPDGTVTTLAGKAGEWGAADGSGSDARFSSPAGICIGEDGNLYIADSSNHTIRRMTPEGAVTTYAGSPLEADTRTGTRLDARFCEPTDIAPHPHGGFIVCESLRNALFRITRDGKVSLLAGNAGQAAVPAPDALSNPSSAASDDAGNIYVTDTFNQEVRLILERFRASIRHEGGTNQLTITWDSLPGRSYQLQMLTQQSWTNAPLAPVLASGLETSVTIPVQHGNTGIYRIMMMGF